MLAPLTVPVSGTVAADGTLSLPVTAVKQMWAMLMASMEQIVPAGVLAASPQWKLVINSATLASQFGQHVDLGPRPVTPFDIVSINLSGGVVGAQVTGAVHGLQSTLSGAAAVHELLTSGYVPNPNLLSLTTVPSVFGQVLKTSAPSFVASGSGTFAVSVGTQSLSIMSVPVSGGVNSTFKLVGANSGFQYYPPFQLVTGPLTGLGTYEIVGVDSVTDPTINWSWTSAVGGAQTWFVSALPTAPPLLVPLPWQTYRPTDSALASFPATGSQASVTFPATAGFFWVLNSIAASLFQTGATGGAANVVVLDGATTKFHQALGVGTAVDALAVMNQSDLRIRGSANTNLVVQFDVAASGTIAESISGSAWLVPI